MRIKKIVSILLICVLLFSLTACDMLPATEPEEAQEAFAPEFSIAPTAEIGSVHLRDKKLLYDMQDPTEVVTMYLTVSSGSAAENTNHTWEEINTYSVYDYDRMGVDRYQVAGLLQVGDENGPVPGELGYGQLSTNCTVQIRGQTSSLRSQKNYKISIKDNKGDWNGQTTIALNKHGSDGLRFRNKLAYDLIAGIDEMLGLRTTFVHLYVRDLTAGNEAPAFEDYGLYTQVEQLNRTALKAHGLNRDGHLYKINFFEFFRYEDIIKLTTDPTYDYKAFEAILETKGDDDHSKLIRMLDAVNDYTIPADEILDRYFDIENMSYWMAFQILMGNHDTQSRNVYIYSPLASEKWYFYSWDHDAALMAREYEMENRTEGAGWDQGVSNYWGNALFQRALKSPAYLAALDAAIEDLYAYMSEERMQTMAEQYKAVVKPYVYRMPDVMHVEFTEEEYDLLADTLHDEIERNYAAYHQSLEKPMPFHIGLPEYSEDGIQYVWDASFDYDAENITYTFELARDHTFEDVILRKGALILPMTESEVLEPGQYFIRVIARNASGQSQYAFDYYVVDSGKVYGTKCFYVMEDGTIVEDVYVEG